MPRLVCIGEKVLGVSPSGRVRLELLILACTAHSFALNFVEALGSKLAAMAHSTPACNATEAESV